MTLSLSQIKTTEISSLLHPSPEAQQARLTLASQIGWDSLCSGIAPKWGNKSFINWCFYRLHQVMMMKLKQVSIVQLFF